MSSDPLNLASRAVRKFKAAGAPALAAALRARVARRHEAWQARSPVLWARFGSASLLLARALRPAPPPLLVLSFPRSGSTWVGETLGQAADAMYLAEPINQSLLAASQKGDFAASRPLPTRDQQRFADFTFAACPAFSRFMVKCPEQWALRERARRRLVVKEVYLAAAAWLVRAYRPRVLFLVRHPAGVALSFQRVGWWIAQPGDWDFHGTLQGRTLRAVLAALQDYPDCRIVYYEDLCEDPLGQFEALFEFAGLQWDKRIQHLIATQTSGGERGQVWGTARDTRRMRDDWRGRVSAAHLAELRAAYAAYDLPWYRADEDW